MQAGNIDDASKPTVCNLLAATPGEQIKLTMMNTLLEMVIVIIP